MDLWTGAASAAVAKLCEYLKVVSVSDRSNPETGAEIHLVCFIENHTDCEG